MSFVNLEVLLFLICQNSIVPGLVYINRRMVFKGRNKVSDNQNSVCSLILLPSKTLGSDTLDAHLL